MLVLFLEEHCDTGYETQKAAGSQIKSIIEVASVIVIMIIFWLVAVHIKVS